MTWAYVSCSGGVVQDVQYSPGTNVLVIDWDQFYDEDERDAATSYALQVITSQAFVTLPSDVQTEIVGDPDFSRALRGVPTDELPFDILEMLT